MIQKIDAPRVNFIILEDISSCNMNCCYCPHWKKNYREKETYLTEEDYFKIYDLALSLLKSQGPVELLHIYTEPLLNWERFKKVLVPLPTGIHHNIFTNGLCLNEDIVNQLLLSRIDISISYDGRFQNQRDSSGKTIQKIPKLVQKFPECFYLMTVIDKNRDVKESVENIKELLQLPVLGVSLQLNHEQDWTKEEIYNFIYTILSNSSNYEISKMGYGGLLNEKDDFLLRYDQMRKNGIYISSRREIYQYIAPEYKIEIGTLDDNDFSFLNNMKNYSPRCFSTTLECSSCPLQSYKNNEGQLEYLAESSSLYCWYRLALYDFFGGKTWINNNIER